MLYDEEEDPFDKVERVVVTANIVKTFNDYKSSTVFYVHFLVIYSYYKFL